MDGPCSSKLKLRCKELNLNYDLTSDRLKVWTKEGIIIRDQHVDSDVERISKLCLESVQFWDEIENNSNFLKLKELCKKLGLKYSFRYNHDPGRYFNDVIMKVYTSEGTMIGMNIARPYREKDCKTYPQAVGCASRECIKLVEHWLEHEKFNNKIT